MSSPVAPSFRVVCRPLVVALGRLVNPRDPHEAANRPGGSPLMRSTTHVPELQQGLPHLPTYSHLSSSINGRVQPAVAVCLFEPCGASMPSACGHRLLHAVPERLWGLTPIGVARDGDAMA